MFEQILLLAMAFFAVAAIAAVVSIIRGRRASFVASLPSTRIPESSWRGRQARRDAEVPTRTSIETNFGEF